ncbi:hypothetical protein ACLMJK_005808 [Lecanora helva]
MDEYTGIALYKRHEYICIIADTFIAWIYANNPSELECVDLVTRSDRRPITPPPCIRLVVQDAVTKKELDINDIDTSYFVLTVDLWTADASQEINLVKHSATSPSISATTAASFPPNEDRAATMTADAQTTPPDPQRQQQPSQRQQTSPYTPSPLQQVQTTQSIPVPSTYTQFSQPPPPPPTTASVYSQPQSSYNSHQYAPPSYSHSSYSQPLQYPPSQAYSQPQTYSHTHQYSHSQSYSQPQRYPQTQTFSQSQAYNQPLAPQHFSQSHMSMYPERYSNGVTPLSIPAPAPPPPQPGYWMHNGATTPMGPMGMGMGQGPLLSPSVLSTLSTDPRSNPGGMFTRNLIGSLCVSAFKLTDPNNNMGVWFILQDLSVRQEGSFRLKMNFVNVGKAETVGTLNTDSAPILATCFSEVFHVFSAKKFPGVIESTNLSRCFATQGIKIPIRKDGPRGNDRRNGDSDE